MATSARSIRKAAHAMPTADPHTAAEIAAYRDELRALGQDTDVLADAEVLLAVIEHRSAALDEREADWLSLVRERTEFQRTARTAARRAAQEDRMAWVGLRINAMIGNALTSLVEVIGYVGQLPDRPTGAQIADLRLAAHRTATALHQHPESPDLTVATRWRDEVWRLRDLITRTARALPGLPEHPGGKSDCLCAGCELIRAMDEVPTDTRPGRIGDEAPTGDQPPALRQILAINGPTATQAAPQQTVPV